MSQGNVLQCFIALMGKKTVSLYIQLDINLLELYIHFRVTELIAIFQPLNTEALHMQTTYIPKHFFWVDTFFIDCL